MKKLLQSPPLDFDNQLYQYYACTKWLFLSNLTKRTSMVRAISVTTQVTYLHVHYTVRGHYSVPDTDTGAIQGGRNYHQQHPRARKRLIDRLTKSYIITKLCHCKDTCHCSLVTWVGKTLWNARVRRMFATANFVPSSLGAGILCLWSCNTHDKQEITGSLLCMRMAFLYILCEKEKSIK